jgi:taurine dioxygenase
MDGWTRTMSQTELSRSDWRDAAALHGLVLRDLSENVGCEVGGIDLSQPVDDTVIEVLRRACAERVVLLFRDQHTLSPQSYLAFSRRFGTRIDLHSQRHYCLPDHHEIFVVGNVEEAGKRIGASRVGLNWHTDHYHLPEPGLFTFLHALVVPPVAGETRYANGIAAYEALSATMQARIDGLKVLHSRKRLFRMLFPEAPEEAVEAEGRSTPDVVHPLVRRHPELQRRGLYLGGEWGSSILGMPEAEATALFTTLLDHAREERFVYSHAWRPGDVLMSDNRCSLHRASEWDEDAYRRRLHRIILIDTVAPVH